MTTREALIAARELIDSPEKWCQKWFTDRKGRHCAVGALMQVCPGDEGLNEARDLLHALTGDEGLIFFNDSHSHAEVLALYDKAIEATQEGVQ